MSRPHDFGLDVVTWHVAFGDFHQGPWHWWHLFSRRGWRHVLAFGFVRGGWIVIDPLMGHMDVRVAVGDEADWLIGTIKAAGGRILKIDRAISHRWSPRGPVYCVTVVKHLLGIDGWSFTPFQLHRALLRRGAVEVFR